MKDYCIWVVSPPGYVHSKAFDELALSLNCAFRALGFQVPIVHNYENIKKCPIILGCNLIPSVDFFRLPYDLSLGAWQDPPHTRVRISWDVKTINNNIG